MVFGLKKEQIKHINQVLASCSKIDEAFIFGSRAKGNYKKGSDIDLALKGKKLNHDDILTMYLLIDNIDLPYTFDLLIFNNKLDKEVREHILRVGKVFYQRLTKVMKDEKLVRSADRLR